MSLIADGRSALSAMLAQPDLFPRISAADYSAAALKLAKKQIIAGGLSRTDQLALKTALGDDIYEKTLDALTAYQIKLLAKRLDPSATPEALASGSMALDHVRAVLSGQPASPAAPTDTPPPKAKNKYIGRKSFRTGR
ncbi:MAG: hypothetical protein V3V03_04970 [Hyphomonadaceae bacterium]